MPQHSGDLSAAERLTILSAGIAVGYVQHYPGDGWKPSAANGLALGAAAVANLISIGASPGVIVWRDWEGLDLSSSSAVSVADMNAWSQQIVAGGFVPGIYLGYDCIFDTNDLTQLTCVHYWRTAGSVPMLVRGYQMIQSLPGESPAPGYDWDGDVVLRDGFGSLPVWDLPS